MSSACTLADLLWGLRIGGKFLSEEMLRFSNRTVEAGDPQYRASVDARNAICSGRPDRRIGPQICFESVHVQLAAQVVASLVEYGEAIAPGRQKAVHGDAVDGCVGDRVAIQAHVGDARSGRLSQVIAVAEPG
jgi:hypothetical protein